MVGARRTLPTPPGCTSTPSGITRPSTASVTATGYGANRITDALRRAGLELTFDPPGVGINPDVYKPDQKPPILKRWEKYRKSKH